MTGFKEFGDYDALGLATLVRKGDVSPTELLEEAITRLHAVDKPINAVPIRHDDFARGQIESGLPEGPFTGVPFLLKDTTLLAGTETSFGSRCYKGYVAKYSSTLVERYLKAGFMIFGKTAMPEFGLDWTTETILYGATRNPWNLDRSTGGSSGGAAAVVAARVLPLAHATDGAGSIRIPAACCGVFGFKPTRARTPVGPDRLEGWGGASCAHAVSLSVRDNAALLDATQGPEPGSPYDVQRPERPYLDEIGRDPGRLRVAFIDCHLDGSAIDEEVAAATRMTASLLEELGHSVEQKRPPRLSADRDETVRTLVYSELAVSLNNRAVELGRPLTTDDFEPLTLDLADRGNKMTAMDCVIALKGMRQIGRDLALYFADFDVLLTPTLCMPPLSLGQLDIRDHDLVAYHRLTRNYESWNGIFNISGQPSMTVPLAWTTDGLPLGMMFSARFGDEATLFRLAAQLEQARPWRNKRPPVAAG